MNTWGVSVGEIVILVKFTILLYIESLDWAINWTISFFVIPMTWETLKIENFRQKWLFETLLLFWQKFIEILSPKISVEFCWVKCGLKVWFSECMTLWLLFDRSQVFTQKTQEVVYQIDDHWLTKKREIQLK